MPLTPQEQAEFDSLQAEFDPQPQTGPAGQLFRSFGSRITDIPQILSRGAIRLGGTLAGAPPELTQAALEEFRTNPELSGQALTVEPPAAPRTGLQGAANITGTIGGEIGKMLAIGRLFPSGGGLAGHVASNAATGAVIDEEHPLKGAVEFGALGGITKVIPGATVPRTLMRVGAQAAIPVATDAATGDLSADTARRAAAFGLLGAGAEALPLAARAVTKAAENRRLLGRQVYGSPAGPEAPPPPEQPIYAELAQPSRRDEAAPTGASTGDFTDESIFEQAFGAPQGASPSATSVPQTGGALQPARQPARLILQTRDQMMRGKGLRPTALNPADEAALFSAPPEAYTKGQDAFPDVVEMARRRLIRDNEIKAASQQQGQKTGAPRETPQANAQTGGKAQSAIPDPVEGVQYQGPDDMGLVHFKDLQTNSNFALKAGDVTPEAIVAKRDATRQRFADNPPISQQDELDKVMGLLLSEKPAESPQPSKRLMALRKSRDTVQADYDAARATGDEEAAVAAQRQLELIDQQVQQAGGESTRKMRLKRNTEEGAAASPLVAALGRGTVGALIGGLNGDDTESRLRNAAIGAAVGVAGVPLLRKALNAGRGALARQAAETRTPGGGSINRTLGKWTGLGDSPELVRASERQRGFEVRYIEPVSRAAAKVSAEERAAVAANQVHASALQDFATNGRSLDTAALKAAGVPDNVVELALRTKEAKLAQQHEVSTALAENPPPPGGISPADWEKLPPAVKRAVMVRDTAGNYQAQSYLLDLDPKSWTKDPAAFDATVKWLKERNPGTSDDILRGQLDTYLTQRYEADAPSFGSGNRVSDSLFLHRKDLSDREWDMLGQLASNPAVPAPIAEVLQKGAASKTLTTLEQKQIALLSGSKSLSDAERQFARNVGERTILPPEFRKLLGEVTDPLQKDLLTVGKLSRSAGAARFINEVSRYTRENGLPAAMTTAEIEAARASGKDVSEYVQLNARSDRPDAPSLGRLADKWVTPDIARRLTDKSLAAPPSTPTGRVAQKAVSVAKQSMTVLNPATHGRQLIQAPLMMIAGRVNAQGLSRAFKTLYEAIGNPDHPLIRQAQEDGIFGAHFARQEFSREAVDFLKPNTGLRKVKRIAFKPIEFARKLYGAPDNLVRFASYLSALERFRGDRDRAVDAVNRYTPNYAEVPGAIKYARNNPLVGAVTNPFISWTGEMLRIGRNLADDLLNGRTARDRMWAAAGLTSIFGVGAITSSASKKLLSKKDREEFDKSERLMKEYQRYQDKVVLGRNKAGGQDFLSTTAITPGGDLVSFAKSLLAGDIPAALSENPIFGLHKNPIVSAAIDVAQGQHHFTGDKLETTGEKARRVGEAFAPPVSPASLLSLVTGGTTPAAGLGYEDRKLKKLVARGGQYADARSGQLDTTPRSLIRNAGVNVQSASLPALQRNAAYETQAKLEEAVRDYRREISAGAPLAVAQRALMKRRQDIAEEYRRLIGR